MVAATLYLVSKFTAKIISDLILFTRYISAPMALRYGYSETPLLPLSVAKMD
jgi:hypothetical protein